MVAGFTEVLRLQPTAIAATITTAMRDTNLALFKQFTVPPLFNVRGLTRLPFATNFVAPEPA